MYDPFKDQPTKYEKFNYNVQEMHKLAIAHLFRNQEILDKRMDEHERAHVAANVAAFKDPKPVEDERKPN
jgi:hypothetical protein